MSTRYAHITRGFKLLVVLTLCATVGVSCAGEGTTAAPAESAAVSTPNTPSASPPDRDYRLETRYPESIADTTWRETLRKKLEKEDAEIATLPVAELVKRLADDCASVEKMSSSNMSSVEGFIHTYRRNPTARGLLKISESGTATERAALREVITTILHDDYFATAKADNTTPSTCAPKDFDLMPVLLAKLDDDNSGLGLLVAIAKRDRRNNLAVCGANCFSSMSTAISIGLSLSLHRIADQKKNNPEFTPEQAAALNAFQTFQTQYLQDYSAPSEVALLEIAHGFIYSTWKSTPEWMIPLPVSSVTREPDGIPCG